MLGISSKKLAKSVTLLTKLVAAIVVAMYGQALHVQAVQMYLIQHFAVSAQIL